MHIENYREQPPTNSLVAIFDIVTENFLFHDWRLLKSKKGGYYIKSPAFSKTDETGKKMWFPFIECKNSEKEKIFNEKVLELLKPYMRDS